MTSLRYTVAAVVLLANCAAPPPPAAQKSEAPAKVSGPHPKESDLAAITLSTEAESRLGILLAPVSSGQSGDVHRFAADVVLPPGRVLIVNAAVSGTLRNSPSPPLPGSMVRKDQLLFELTPILPIPRDLKITADADLEQAVTRVETAKLRQARAGRATSRAWLQVPWPAIVFDINGGAWIYEKAAERRYVRRRVTLGHTANGIAYLVSGPSPGTPVVIAGVAELWGTEFGAGK